jgi:transcriptional regulator with XRE-family HTH domain
MRLHKSVVRCVAVTQSEIWSAALHKRIAKAIRNAREGSLSAQQLADETERLGYPMTRSQIANYENGRKLSLDVAELLVLAEALKVPPVALLFGGPPDKDVEILPDWPGPAFCGIAWFCGDRELAWPGPEVTDPDDARAQAEAMIADPDSPAARVLRLVRKRAELHRDLMLSCSASKRQMASWKDEDFDRAVTHDARLIEEIDEITAEIGQVVAESQGDAE